MPQKYSSAGHLQSEEEWQDSSDTFISNNLHMALK